ncbi:protein crumbs homolog 1-like [Pristis pectinata]|uniref:protein crumbs homolog 1-like n=1 Tax=Pristis pectinata TaxID=685728 RepID=UPI00223DD9C3|nr:protein crumbs homolog 1-like [Pristis pectinata]
MERKRGSSHSAVLILMFLFFWGNLCSTEVNECLSEPCQNNGICIAGLDNYTCQCPRDPVIYFGKNCELLFDACHFQLCMNNGTCHTTLGSLQYNCTCLPGFAGTQCSLNINECESNPCRGLHVDCIDQVNGYSCRCSPGYEGENCTTEINQCLTNSCKNNGTCLDGIGNYTCDCQPGYTGVHCETDIDECASSPCLNGALCIQGVNKYRCFCVPGYQGSNCEIDINECASKPCRNGATCVHDVDRYLCVCPLGYKGLNCDIEINECESNPCQNGAMCKDHVASYGCTCAVGYKGVNCEIDIDECASNPCINGGMCKDLINGYTCDCDETGFQGTNCEVDILECASDPCINNATCLEGVKNYSCLCWPGYTGQLCETDINECTTQPCVNNGTCLERSSQEYYGNLPQFKSTFSYTSASGYVCLCQRGFTGENCSVNIDECESGPCMNGGTCEDQTNGFQCHCAPGFTGVTCQSDINECEDRPCENGGTCEDSVADYTCHCPPAGEDGMTWGGKKCSVQLTGCLEHNCYNGATCIPNLVNDIHGYFCRCPPGFYDAFCSTSTTVSLYNGFIIVHSADGENQTNRRTVDESVSISMRLRTTLPNAVLIYRGDLNEYIHIQIYSGLLMSRAVISGQVMDISFSSPVNDGTWHQLRVLLGKNFLVKLSHPSCPNQTCSDSKPIKSATLPSLDAFQKTYIGGYPGMYLTTQENFTGCLQDLEIDNKPILPQTFTNDTAWNFKVGCEKTNWCNQNPCNSNGMCIDLWTSYTCDCFRPYTGPTCIQEYIPVTFSNNSSSSSASFVIMDNPGSKFAISFFIRTRNPNSFILQLRNATAPYLSTYLQNGSISIKIQGMKLDTSRNLADGIRRLIELHMDEGWLTVKESDVVLRELLLPRASIQQFDSIHIGQDPEEDSTVWGGPFKGCLQDVRVNNNLLEFYPLEIKDYTLSLEVYTNKTLVNVIKDCISDDTCKPAPCQNGGNCTVTWNDFECKCPQQYTGRTCEEIVWCATDPCPSEYRCLDLPGGYECLANATFRGENPIVYTSNKLITRDLTSISIDFKTRDTAAVLLQASHGAESFWFGFHNSQLQCKLYSGNSVEGLTLSTTINISDGQWHTVLVTMEEPSKISSRWIITVDGNSNVTSTVTAGNVNFLQDNAEITVGNNFTGCLGVVRISGIYLPYINQKVVTKTEQFVIVSDSPTLIGCLGAEVCSPNPCLNNGMCEDLFDLFQCDCISGWEGTRCEVSVDDCVSRPCIHGNCSNLLQGYRCNCDQGFTGVNCENDIDDCTDHRCINQGSCIDGLNSYYCNCPSQFTGRYCEWLYPPAKCGEGLSCNNGGLCTDGVWGANCTCKPGFTGERCEVEVNVCESNPCQNGATCQNMVNAFECICAANFAGEQCELDRGNKADSIPLLAVAVPVVCGTVLLIVIALIFVVLTARKKRQTEGTYNPSQQEVAGARLEMDSVLKVPPEERLI